MTTKQSLICLCCGASFYNDCNSCDTWRMLVWEDGGVDPADSWSHNYGPVPPPPYRTNAGKYYAGHKPCTGGCNNLPECGTWTLPGKCADTANGTDSQGHGCDVYAHYPRSCGCCDTKTFHSKEMCCACGGGGRPTPPPSPPLGPPSYYYSDPFMGSCRPNETKVHVKYKTPGGDGPYDSSVCAKKCVTKADCPAPPSFLHDVVPDCLFEDTLTLEKYCGLTCFPSDPNSCSKCTDVTCKQWTSKNNPLGGVCTYNGNQ